MIQNRKTIALVLSGFAVTAVAIFGKSGVPLYDGVGFPDEPYRYADIAHTPKTKPPDVPSLIFLKSDALHGISLQSSEVGPQVVVYISPSSTSLSPGVTQATLAAQPIKPTVQPIDGKIAGNVYRVNGSAENGTFNIVTPAKNSYNYINLRLPQGYNSIPAMEFRPLRGGDWRRLNSNRIGNDIYESVDINSFGDYALVQLPKNPSRNQQYAKHDYTSAYVAAGFAALVAIMAGVILLIRHDQKRKNKKS